MAQQTFRELGLSDTLLQALDKKGFTERRPWAADPKYKASYGERIPAGHSGASVPKQMKQFTKKASGGLIRGFPKIAKKGWK